MPSSPDQGGDGIVVIDSSSPHKPIAWGASDAFKLSRDLQRRPGPDVQLDASLTQRNRQARDRSLMLAHERLIQRTQFAGREAPGQSSVGQ